MGIPILPSAAGSLPASSPCRKAIERRFEKTDYCARECQGPSSPLVPASVGPVFPCRARERCRGRRPMLLGSTDERASRG